MKRFILLAFYCSFFTLPLWAQTLQDSVAPPDSLAQKTLIKKPVDSLRRKRIRDSSVKLNRQASDTIITPEIKIDEDPGLIRVKAFQQSLRNHPFYGFYNKPVRLFMLERNPKGNELLFYVVIALLLYFALIRLFFSKYLNNLFSLFFRATLRQQQIREQLLQTPLPSLLLNLLFILSGGMYAGFIVRYYGLMAAYNFWELWLYCSLILLVIYLCKYCILKGIGWIFRVKGATDTYIFIVFLINKIIGMFLLPSILFMAFPNQLVIPIVVVLSLIMVVALFIYRYIISYKPVQNEIKVSAFQFFIYLCAFEIAPLLLIYKVLLDFVERSL